MIGTQELIIIAMIGIPIAVVGYVVILAIKALRKYIKQ
jgi:hypothetical protein